MGMEKKHIPLLIQAVVANFEDQSVLVYQGSSADIIYVKLHKIIGINEKDLTPYRGSYLFGFNRSWKPLDVWSLW